MSLGALLDVRVASIATAGSRPHRPRLRPPRRATSGKYSNVHRFKNVRKHTGGLDDTNSQFSLSMVVLLPSDYPFTYETDQGQHPPLRHRRVPGRRCRPPNRRAPCAQADRARPRLPAARRIRRVHRNLPGGQARAPSMQRARAGPSCGDSRISSTLSSCSQPSPKSYR